MLALIRAYEGSPEFARFAPATVDATVRYLAPLLDMAAIPVANVKRKHLMLIRDALAEIRGHGAATQFCRRTSALFSWAVDRQWIDNSPAVRLNRGLDSGELPTWTMEQAQKAIRDLPEPYRRAVVLALHTGQRRGDLCRLRWSSCTDGRIVVTQQKTKRTVSIPIVPELAFEIEAWRRDTKGLTVLQTERGIPWQPQYLSASLPRELAKIGLPVGLNIHGLRKLAAVRLAEAGCSIHEIAAITGHKTLAMVQHYTTAASQRTLSDAAVLKLRTGKDLQTAKNE